MNKKDLETLIRKYNLDDNCKSVKWKVKDKNLTIDFTNEECDVSGTLESNFDLPDNEFGVYDTNKLLTILPALDNEVELSYHYERNHLVGLNFSDKVVNGTFMLADLSVIYSEDQEKSIQRIQRLKDDENLPEFDLELDLKKEFTDRFVKSKRALANSQVLAVIPFDNEADFVINYSSTPSDRISIPVKCTIKNIFDLMGFNANMLSSIFSANSDFREGKLRISSKGLLVLDFINEDSKTRYFMKPLDLK